MPPTNANPGAGGARVHGISKSDAVPTTRNQLPAQSNPAARSAQANAALAAEAILHAARGLGICVTSNDDDVVMIAPLRLPHKTRRWFEIWLNNFRAEVIAAIQADAAARREVRP
jgi:hypothetical protein